jgi:3D-(3,5/4)-trihydroxycyclohexane-1,2-dione acylhydrolase (decyclizing)
VQGEAYDFPAAFFAERTWIVARRPPADEELRAAVDALASAARPILIAGGGCAYSDAGVALRRLAESHGLPVAETSAGKGVLPGDSPMSVGGIGHSGTRAANRLARRADVVLCAGTRLIDLTTGSNTLFEAPGVRFVGLNLSPFDSRKLGALPLLADARLGLERLTAALDAAGHCAREEWLGEVAAAREDWRAALEADRRPREGERMSQHQVLHALNRAARPGDTLVVASGTPHVDVHKAWDTWQGAAVQMEVGFSTMGHEIPAALGVRMARGSDGEIYALIGDGTYLMGHSELVTAVQEALKITVVLIDNHGYQSIHALQRGRLDRSFGLEFRTPVDYAANARSYGCAAFEADTPEEVERALEAARAQELPSVIVCRTEPHRLILESECWWDVGVPEVSTRPETAAAAARSAEGRSQMRWHG